MTDETNDNSALAAMSAETILKMIEEADPSDCVKLDEIDLEFWRFLTNLPIYKIDIGWDDEALFLDKNINQLRHDLFPTRPAGTEVTRSRDALKAIRPSGSFVALVMKVNNKTDADIRFKICEPDRDHHWKGFWAKDLPTEELAELHVIIQAIHHKRTKQ